jgi:hypothetical protein
VMTMMALLPALSAEKLSMASSIAAPMAVP